jgi:cellulose synthase operon protein YhjQ
MSQDEQEYREEVEDAPDDVATLYAWANLHGAKYRDFSASRREHRAQMRATLQAEAARAAAEAASRPHVQQPSASERERREISHMPSPADDTQVVYVKEFTAQPPHERGTGQAPLPYQPAAYPPPSAPRHEPAPPRPAWLYAESQQPPQSAPPAQMRESAAPARPQRDRGSERGQDRWFALKGVFDQSQHPEPSSSASGRVPIIAVFSLAGGVGKTSLVATLGRALSSFGERSMLVDASPQGLLPYYFGSREARPGVVRTFSPPGGTPDAPIHLLSLDTESRASEGQPDWIGDTIVRSAVGMQRVVIDATTASGHLAKQIMHVATCVLVPIVPDLNSVVSLTTVDNFFRQQTGADGRPVAPFYLLNQFDASLPLHLDVREVLRQQLGDRLLPTVVRRSPAVSEALAEGMTVVDYAPNSPVTEDYLNIAAWLRNVSAPAAASFRGSRWSER